MVERVRGKTHTIEHDDPGGAESLCRDGIFLFPHDHAANDQSQPSQKTERNAHFRRDKISFEGVFNEERHAKEQREAAYPRKQLHAEKLFPIDHMPRFGLGCEGWNKRRRSDRWRSSWPRKNVGRTCLKQCLDGSWCGAFGRFERGRLI